MRLSWNRDEDGVITVFAMADDGKGAPVADFWVTPIIAGLGISRARAMALQQELAEMMVDAHNSSRNKDAAWVCPIKSPGCEKNCGSYCCGN